MKTTIKKKRKVFVESGRKGGYRRWGKRTPEERSEIMTRVSHARASVKNKKK